MSALIFIPFTLYSFSFFRNGLVKWIPYFLSVMLSVFALGSFLENPFVPITLVVGGVIFSSFWDVYFGKLKGFNPIEICIFILCFNLQNLGLIGEIDFLIVFWFLRMVVGEPENTSTRATTLSLPFLYFFFKIITNNLGAQITSLSRIELLEANLSLVNIHLSLFGLVILCLWLLTRNSLRSFLSLGSFKKFWETLLGAVLIITIGKLYSGYIDQYKLMIVSLSAIELCFVLFNKSRGSLLLFALALLSYKLLALFILVLPLMNPGMISRWNRFSEKLPGTHELIGSAVLVVSFLIVHFDDVAYRLSSLFLFTFLVALLIKLPKSVEVAQ